MIKKTTKKKPLVSVVIVTLSNIDWLKKSLHNLYGQNYKNIEVFVVDNGSSDNTPAVVRKYFKKVIVIETGENLGFGRAANRAIKKAKGKYIFIYNDDAFLENDSLGKMVAKMESDISIASLQGTILFYSRKTIVESGGNLLTNLGILEKKEGYKYVQKNEVEHEIFSANLPLMRASVLKKLGGFDEDYFLYFEEADLSWRIWLAGYRVIYFPGAVMYHERGVTTKKTSKPRVLKSTYKNRVDSLIKNLELKNLFVILASNIFVAMSGVLIFLIKFKIAEAVAIFAGTFSFLFHLPNILKKRSRIQSMRKIGDTVLFKKVFKFMSPVVLLKGALNYFLAW